MGRSPLERLVSAAASNTDEPLGLLQVELERRLQAAAAATPGVNGDLGDFCAYLAARLDPQKSVLAELQLLYVEDLFLAWALGRNDRAAFRRFERELLPRLATQVKSSLQPAAGELEQSVRTRLFVPKAGELPRIQQYSGRGPLGAWLRMLGTRAALDLRRAENSQTTARELESPAVVTDPELDYLKLRYAGDFKLALEQALQQLTARQVTLLKLSFLDQLASSAIATMYNVSNRTVQRWLSEVKDAVLSGTREALKARLALTPTELDSLLGLMHSQLELSLQRVLTRTTGQLTEITIEKTTKA